MGGKATTTTATSATAAVNLDRLRELAAYFAGTRGVEVSIGTATTEHLYVAIGGVHRTFRADLPSDEILDLMGHLARERGEGERGG